MQIIAFVFGALIGSFLNVCILRVPKEESIVFPASHCMKCKKPLAWFDNIPVFSFLLLNGKCRHCRKPISWQYPAIELLTAALFVIFYVKFGLTLKGIVFLALTLAFLVESVIDFRYQIIPDGITLTGIGAGFGLSLVFPQMHGQAVWWAGAREAIFGILLGGGFLYVLGTVAEWVLKKEAMGGGDVKLLAMIGAFLGWQGVLWTLFVSSFIGALAGIVFKVITGEEKIPFGPFIAIAAVSYMFVGPQIIHLYFNYLHLS